MNVAFVAAETIESALPLQLPIFSVLLTLLLHAIAVIVRARRRRHARAAIRAT